MCKICVNIFHNYFEILRNVHEIVDSFYNKFWNVCCFACLFHSSYYHSRLACNGQPKRWLLTSLFTDDIMEACMYSCCCVIYIVWFYTWTRPSRCFTGILPTGMSTIRPAIQWWANDKLLLSSNTYTRKGMIFNTKHFIVSYHSWQEMSYAIL